MRISFCIRLLVTLFAFLIASPLFAAIELPYLFSSHAVLQRNKPIAVWGKAAAGEKVTVRLHSQTALATANNNGNWTAVLKPEAAGGPYQLKISGKNETITLDDVMIGEVWVCSGQSNMEWPLDASMNAKEEIAAATDGRIRQFDVPNKIAFSPQWNSGSAAWQVCSPSTAGRFSAVAYFFARKLTKELGVAVGLVNSSWGGTVAEAWTSVDALKRHPDFARSLTETPMTEAAYAAALRKRAEQRIQAFQGSVKATDEGLWKTTGFADAGWPSLAVDKFWEEQGLAGFDGVMWYRTEFDLSSVQAMQDAVLHLGTIDDDDSTFVNGEFIGATAQWNAERKYSVAKGKLKEGRNLIAVRVTDGTGNRGFYGNGSRIIRFANGDSLSFPTKWKAQVSSGAAPSLGNPNGLPASLYNGMIHPLIPYTIRGALWYQGESNADRAKQYETLLPLLIRNWRSVWKGGDFPFYFVQLSSYDPQHKPQGSKSTWAELREAQRKATALLNTGMAVTIDIGERDDIHPKNKQDVGLRLALVALKKTYGKNVVASGPVLKDAVRNGNEITLRFDERGSGLATRTGSEVESVEVVDKDGKAYAARATIKVANVVAMIPNGVQPVAIRYAWKDDAGDANLQNKEGLPAVPFWYGLK